jgi:hypothetical protein
LRATIRITTENSATLITIDGTRLGNGGWQGHVNPGRHLLEIRRPSGEVLQQKLDVAAGMTYSIRDTSPQKRPESKTEAPAAQPVGPPPSMSRPRAPNSVSATLPVEPTNQAPFEAQNNGAFRGITGEAFVPIILGGASTDSYGTSCPATEFGGSCSIGGPRGGALAVRVGYSFGWIAPEATLGMSLDISSAGLHLPADLQIPGDTNGLLAQVAGDTHFARLGMMAGGGVRLATQAQGLRYSLSGMLGLVKRHVYIFPDYFFGSKPSYTAKTLFFDTGVMLGDSPGVKVYAGLFLWLEFVPSTVVSRDVTRLGLDPAYVPASLRTITPFSGTQVMFGPLLGISFGH